MPFDDLSGITVPRAFGTYRVLHQAGGGGLGPVFRAHDAEQDCLAAVKVFGRDCALEEVIALGAALEELTRRPRLDPLFVPLFDAGVEGPLAFLAMEYEPGQTLDQALRHLAPAPVEQVVALLEPLARAIDTAWATGLGHGALHPRDLFLSANGTLERVTGFGVVQALERAGRTPPPRRAYGAPERGRPGWDVRADVFSLGAIAHELLTRRRPIGPGEQDGELGPDIPARQRVQIRTVLDTALAERPDARFSSAAALLTALADTIGLRIDRPAPEPPRFSMPVGGDDGGLPPFMRPAVAQTVPSEPALSEPAPFKPAPFEAALSEAASMEPVTAQSPGVEPAAAGAAADAVPAAVPVEDVVLIQAPRPIGDTETDDDRDTPGADIDRWDLERPPAVAGPPPPALGAPARRALPRAIALTLAGLLVGSGAVYLVMHRQPRAEKTATSGSVLTSRAESGSAAPRSAAPRSESRDAASTAPATRPAPDAGGVPGAGAAAARPQAPSATRAVPAAARGAIAVRSEPTGALVTIDGHRVGATPVSAGDLPLGRHTMLVARPGYVPRTEQVTLTSATPTRTLVVRLTAGADVAPVRSGSAPVTGGGDGQSASAGAIDVDSRPRGARVSIDGRFLGLAPLRLSELAPGAHTLLLEAEGKSSVSRRVQVEAGQVTRVRVDLE